MKKNTLEIFFKQKKWAVREKEPPKRHKERFLAKLEIIKARKTPVYSIVLKYAAIGLLLISLSQLVVFQLKKYKLESNSSIKVTEDYFTKVINYELEKVTKLKNSSNEKVIENAKEKIYELEKEYKIILKDFNKNSENTLLIQMLIQNLEHRIEVLKELNQRLTNLKINNYENEII